MQFFTILDFIISPVYLAIIYFISRMIQKRRIEERPEYKFYLKALTAKITGGIALCLVYTTYYTGGDTTQYFTDGIIINKLLFTDPAAGMDIILNGLNREKLSYFDVTTGYPSYWREPSTSFVVQITTVLTILGLRSFVPTTILMSWISFIGIWNLYRVFLNEFPKLSRQMAIAIFFIPSMLFWGSGILKDTITLSATGYFVYAFYKGFIIRENLIRNTIVLIISAYIIIVVKAYIFIALLPGVMIWWTGNIISRIRGRFLKYSMAPLFLIFTISGAYLLLIYMGSSFGKFSADQILERAVISQRDLKSDWYRGNSFDIGDFDSSIGSILSVSHRAVIAGAFRPFITEANNIMMFISGLENLFFLILFIRVLFLTRIVGFFKYFTKHPLLTFSLIFSTFFFFSVGLSSSNFGSLVRYKILAIPFFVASMYIIINEEKIKRRRKKFLNENSELLESSLDKVEVTHR